MGYIRHHAIAVSTWDEAAINKANLKAIEIFGELVSGIIKSKINGYVSFFIAPDGSKEGWSESNEGDKNREQFINWINSEAYSDGSNVYSYAEFYYGDDDGGSMVINHN